MGQLLRQTLRGLGLQICRVVGGGAARGVGTCQLTLRFCFLKSATLNSSTQTEFTGRPPRKGYNSGGVSYSRRAVRSVTFK